MPQCSVLRGTGEISEENIKDGNVFIPLSLPSFYPYLPMSTWDCNPVPAVPAAPSSLVPCGGTFIPHAQTEQWLRSHSDWHLSNPTETTKPTQTKELVQVSTVKVTYIRAPASAFPFLPVPPKPETWLWVHMAMAPGCAQQNVTALQGFPELGPCVYHCVWHPGCNKYFFV